MVSIKAIIIDDESPARSELEFLLQSNCPEIDVVKQFDNALDALQFISTNKVELIFLDIEMPETSGIEFARIINDQLESIPFIIFVSAYDQFAIDAFRLNATDYILKPVSIRFLKQAVEKVLKWKKGETFSIPLKAPIDYKDDHLPKRITLNAGEKLVPMNLEEVIVATVVDKMTYIFTSRGRFTYSGTLVELEDQLSSNRFFRCHKSYLINIFSIESIDIWFNGGLQVKLQGYKDLVPVSRNYAKEFKKAINFR